MLPRRVEQRELKLVTHVRVVRYFPAATKDRPGTVQSPVPVPVSIDLRTGHAVLAGLRMEKYYGK